MARIIIKDSQFYGGYFNIERHSIFRINNHIAGRFGLSIFDNEEKIATSFLQNKSMKNSPNWDYVFCSTARFMPIIKVFDFEMLPKKYCEKLEQEGKVPESTKEIKGMQEMLGIIFREINAFRNDYLHYYSTIYGTNRKTTVDTKLVVSLNDTFKLAIEYAKDHMKYMLTSEDYYLVEKIIMVDPNNELTIHSLVFFICMFLEREQAYHFISKVIGLRGTQFSSFIATHEVFMSFCVKLPHDKLVSEDLKQQTSNQSYDFFCNIACVLAVKC